MSQEKRKQKKPKAKEEEVSHQEFYEDRPSGTSHVSVPYVWDDLNPDDVCCVVDRCGQIVCERDFAAHLKEFHKDYLDKFTQFWDPIGAKVCFLFFLLFLFFLHPLFYFLTEGRFQNHEACYSVEID